MAVIATNPVSASPQDGTTIAYMSGNDRYAQEFITPNDGNSYSITSLDVWLQRSGSVSGTLYVDIYASSGSYGSGTPTGSVLGTSDAFTIDNSLPTAFGVYNNYNLTFSGSNRVLLSPNTPYTFVFRTPSGAGNFVFAQKGASYTGYGSYSNNAGASYSNLSADYKFTLNGLATTIGVTKTQSGVANIFNTTQRNQLGVAAIAGQYLPGGWGFSVPGITYWGLGPVAIQAISYNQDQTGKARITATTSQTQTGVARITTTSTKTQTGKARITATTTKTQTGKARITATTTKTQTGKARIRVSTSRTQTGRSRITQVVSQTQTGVAKLLSSAVTTTQTINGVARITTVSSQTQTGKASILNSVTRTQTGLARIALITSQAQTGRARINVTVQKTQTGVSRIETTTSATQTGKARITNSSSVIQTGIARITVVTPQTQTGKAAIAVEVNQTITGKARIEYITGQTQSGKAYIINDVIGNGAYIPQFGDAGGLEEGNDPDNGAYIPQFGGAGSLAEAGTPDDGSYIPQFPTSGELK